MLDTLEQNSRCSPADKALILLALALPDVGVDELRSLPVGERDARLASLRGRLFGHGCESIVDCPACHESLEFELDSRVLFGEQTGKPSSNALSLAGYRLRFRLPTSEDLLAVAQLPDLDGARSALLQRCIEQVETENGAGIEPAQLPEEVETAIEQAMELADPHGNPTLMLDCPNCGHHWQILFDILSFFLLELNDWARRLLQDVHSLALAYGWSESAILALSPWRRRTYLEMLGT